MKIMAKTLHAFSMLIGLGCLRTAAALAFVQSSAKRLANAAVPLSRQTCRASSTMTEQTAATTSNNPSESYEELVARLKTLSSLRQSKAVLSYDQLVFMPDAASAARGDQLAALASVIHEKATSAELGELLSTCEKEDHNDDQDETAKKVLQLTRKDYDKATKIPAALVAKKAALSAAAYAAWTQARQHDDFASFAPVLQDCFTTAMDVARAVRVDNNTSLYTQMLDDFETGMPAARIDEVFGRIEEQLVPLLNKVLASDHKPDTSYLQSSTEQGFAVDDQTALSKSIVTALGYNTSRGRIDVSVHPFTTSFSPDDVRITSRFSTNDWTQGLMGSIHESGHAMYEQSLGPSGLSIDSALSMGTHESQSLFWERHVAKSRPFWQWATPLLNEKLGTNYEAEQVYRAINVVQPSLIRVEADELTYPLHVILRYKLERDVVEGKIQVIDIPQRWNAMMQHMLGVTVPNDTKGCLQDVHWSAFAIGYFPTYLIGSATAAQLVYYCKKDLPDFDQRLESGGFAAIKAWLTDKVHKHGQRYNSLDELLQSQVGEPLNPQYLVDYLRNKYSELYHL